MATSYALNIGMAAPYVKVIITQRKDRHSVVGNVGLKRCIRLIHYEVFARAAACPPEVTDLDRSSRIDPDSRTSGPRVPSGRKHGGDLFARGPLGSGCASVPLSQPCTFTSSVRIHELRLLVALEAMMNGESLPVLGKILDHAQI